MKFEIHVDGYIGPDDFFSLMEGGSSFNLKKLNDAIASMPSDTDEIDVMINSGGGLVNEGFAIHDRLKSLGLKVNTIVLGQCGSIATVVAQANANGGIRKIYENSDYYIHNPYYTPTGPDAMEAADLAKLQEELQKSQDKILNFYHEVTGTKKSELKKRMDAGTSLSSDEVKSLGFADEVIPTVITNQKKYAIAAYINFSPSKNPIMLDLKKLFTDFEAKMLTNIQSIVKTKVKNAVTATKDGVNIYYDGKLEKGTKVYTDEAMTISVSDGEYTFPQEIAMGTDTIVVKDGAVDSLKQSVPVAANNEATLQAEVDRLKTENAKLTGDLTAAANKVTEVENTAKAAVEEVKTEFNNFKSNFFTGTELKPEIIQAFKGKTEEVVKDPVQQLKDFRAEKKRKADEANKK